MVFKIILCFLILSINYHLAITYLGVYIPLKKTIVPSILLSVTAFISKELFGTSPVLHTLIVVITCTAILYLITKISLLLSVIGSLLSFITLTIGSLLLVCPFLICLGIKIPFETDNINWIYLNIAELIIPAIILIIFRYKKISIIKAFG